MPPHSISVYIICILSLTTYVLTNFQLALGTDVVFDRSDNDTICSSRQKSSVKNSEQSLHYVLAIIDSMCDRLGLDTTVKCQASEIIKKVMDRKSLRYRNRNATCAACVYLACRVENKTRTIAEIISVTKGATRKEFCHASKFIKKQLDGEGQITEVRTVQAGDLLGHFGSSLGMNFSEIEATREAVQKVEELNIRRAPKTIAATVIYIISKLSSNKRSLNDISGMTHVAESTIMSYYKDLRPYLVRIIPCWYASEDEINALNVKNSSI